MGIAVDGENMSDKEIRKYIEKIEYEFELPATDILRFGAHGFFDRVINK